MVGAAIDRPVPGRTNHAKFGWSPTDEGPVRAKVNVAYPGIGPGLVDDPRHPAESLVKPRPLAPETPFAREGELMSKLHDLLHSPFGECITGIVDDLHQVLAQIRCSG